MNIDDDVIEDMDKRVAVGGAENISALARAGDRILNKTARNMQGRRSCEYMAAGGLMGTYKGDLSAGADGTRVGNPGEDTSTLLTYSHAVHRGMVTPQQVLFHTGNIHK